MSNEVIPELSTSTPLLSFTSWQSNPIIAGQYTAYTFSYFVDQDINAFIQFSDDGINFDISEEILLDANTRGSHSTVIKGKWTRIIIENNTLNNMNTLRFYTYATIQNSTLTAILQGEEGKNPVVDIGNFTTDTYGDLNIVNLNLAPNCQFNFDRADISGISLIGFDPLINRCPYIINYGSATLSTAGVYASTEDGITYINGMNSLLTQQSAYYSSYSFIPYTSGRTFVLRFNCIFKLEAIDHYYTYKVGGCFPYKWIDNEDPEGFYIKWDGITDQFCIEYLGDNIFQNNFNLDKLNGFGPSELILDPFIMNTFQISGSPDTQIIFSIYKPGDKIYIPFHTIIPSEFFTPQLSFYMYARSENPADYSFNSNYGVGVNSWEAYFTGETVLNGVLHSIEVANIDIQPSSLPVYTVTMYNEGTSKLRAPTIFQKITALAFPTNARKSNYLIFKMTKIIGILDTTLFTSVSEKSNVIYKSGPVTITDIRYSVNLAYFNCSVNQTFKYSFDTNLFALYPGEIIQFQVVAVDYPTNFSLTINWKDIY